MSEVHHPDSEKVLTYTIGEFHFSWFITSQEIYVYHWVEAEPQALLGRFTTKDAHGKVVDFEQTPFERHCQWLICIAAKVAPEDLR